MFINDVGGGLWEEITRGLAGANYGWPITEGVANNPNYVDPLYAYDHTNQCAISGGTFYTPLTPRFAPAYFGAYFFADYCGGWIQMARARQRRDHGLCNRHFVSRRRRRFARRPAVLPGARQRQFDGHRRAGRLHGPERARDRERDPRDADDHVRQPADGGDWVFAGGAALNQGEFYVGVAGENGQTLWIDPVSDNLVPTAAPSTRVRPARSDRPTRSSMPMCRRWPPAGTGGCSSSTQTRTAGPMGRPSTTPRPEFSRSARRARARSAYQIFTRSVGAR
jgi:hypothetical protein